MAGGAKKEPSEMERQSSKGRRGTVEEGVELGQGHRMGRKRAGEAVRTTETMK